MKRVRCIERSFEIDTKCSPNSIGWASSMKQPFTSEYEVVTDFSFSNSGWETTRSIYSQEAVYDYESTTV
jgi:hypothetical protein